MEILVVIQKSQLHSSLSRTISELIAILANSAMLLQFNTIMHTTSIARISASF